MTKQNNTILWVLGIILFLLVLTHIPLKLPFAIVTKTTCMDGTVSYWDLDGNVLDAQGINNGVNNGAIFVSGKLGQATEFNTTTYIDFPTVNAVSTIMWIKNYSTSSDWYFVVDNNGTNYVNGVLDNTKQIIPIGPSFGLGFNGSVDEAAAFNRELSLEEISTLYSVKKVCYTTTYEENISCKDYATEQVTDSGTGCLNYSGDYFPNCEYEWETTSGFYVSGNVCEKRFYCENILSSDYSSLTLCQDSLVVTEEPIDDTTITTTTTTTTTTETFKDKLNKEVFEIGGFGVKLIYLIVALIIVIALIYLMKDGKKK